MLNRVELFRLFEVLLLVCCNELNIKGLLIGLSKAFFFLPRLNQTVDDSACVIVALKSPAERVFGCFKESHSPCALFRYMVIDILTVHIFLSKIASLILKDLTV